ncbi:gamma-subunit of ethylbenzene dehydrogenase [hydrothermal vent metagenome]|uniref:Gamma-subunit of ethylbenzene dehydrogenase n=1 Tax=hydrothermal vent metagenome TaxID=652676 RepID=A0A1W1CG13_9ZZZZ
MLALVILSANPTIPAYRVSDDVNLSNIKYDDDVWRYAKDIKVTLYPQTTLLMNDKRANRLQLNSSAKIARVSSLYNSSHISIKLKWRDVNRSISTLENSDRYDDAFAIEIPVDYANPKKLPYIGMGSKGRAVEVYYSSTSHTRDRAFVAEGFRESIGTIDSSEFNMSISYDGNISWRGVLTRAMRDDYVDLNKSSVFPLSFAIWRGDRLGRAELKLISGWTPLKLQKKRGDETLISELSYTPKGSIKIGREIAQDKCSSCHILENNSTTIRYIAPNLSNIGGYATKEYIRESISDPDEVIVDGYSPKAYPKFLWYNVDENGTRHSNMPSVVLDKDSTKHLLRYLMSLKSKPTKGK